MFKKITVLATLAGLSLSSASFAYTATDVSNANYLSSRGIIRDASSNPENYFLENRISRTEIMGMLIKITGVARNTSCRGDFPDINMNATNAEWVCRTVETAADRGYINAMSGVAKINRLVRPYEYITRAEALGILMKAFPNTGVSSGYAYYWTSNFPIDGTNIGYSEYYNFGAEWQAATFYEYIRKVLLDDTELSNNPRVNEQAKLKEIFGFAKKIMEKR